MAKTFKTKKGTTTNIFNSYGYYKATAKQRTGMAFNKPFLDSLSQRDKNLMRGYAQAKIEELERFKYKNPNYKRKTSGKPNWTSNIAQHWTKY